MNQKAFGLMDEDVTHPQRRQPIRGRLVGHILDSDQWLCGWTSVTSASPTPAPRSNGLSKMEAARQHPTAVKLDSPNKLGLIQSDPGVLKHWILNIFNKLLMSLHLLQENIYFLPIKG